MVLIGTTEGGLYAAAGCAGRASGTTRDRSEAIDRLQESTWALRLV